MIYGQVFRHYRCDIYVASLFYHHRGYKFYGLLAEYQHGEIFDSKDKYRVSCEETSLYTSFSDADCVVMLSTVGNKHNLFQFES
jgi:hypothetical protein